MEVWESAALQQWVARFSFSEVRLAAFVGEFLRQIAVEATGEDWDEYYFSPENMQVYGILRLVEGSPQAPSQLRSNQAESLLGEIIPAAGLRIGLPTQLNWQNLGEHLLNSSYPATRGPESSELKELIEFLRGFLERTLTPYLGVQSHCETIWDSQTRCFDAFEYYQVVVRPQPGAAELSREEAHELSKVAELGDLLGVSLSEEYYAGFFAAAVGWTTSLGLNRAPDQIVEIDMGEFCLKRELLAP